MHIFSLTRDLVTKKTTSKNGHFFTFINCLTVESVGFDMSASRCKNQSLANRVSNMFMRQDEFFKTLRPIGRAFYYVCSRQTEQTCKIFVRQKCTRLPSVR